MVSAFKPGDPVVWHYEAHDGSNITNSIPGVVIRTSSGAVEIEMRYPNAERVRVWVRPDYLQHRSDDDTSSP
jgi:hypothetical protein